MKTYLVTLMDDTPDDTFISASYIRQNLIQAEGECKRAKDGWYSRTDENGDWKDYCTECKRMDKE